MIKKEYVFYFKLTWSKRSKMRWRWLIQFVRYPSFMFSTKQHVYLRIYYKLPFLSLVVAFFTQLYILLLVFIVTLTSEIYNNRIQPRCVFVYFSFLLLFTSLFSLTQSFFRLQCDYSMKLSVSFLLGALGFMECSKALAFDLNGGSGFGSMFDVR